MKSDLSYEKMEEFLPENESLVYFFFLSFLYNVGFTIAFGFIK